MKIIPKYVCVNMYMHVCIFPFLDHLLRLEYYFPFNFHFLINLTNHLPFHLYIGDVDKYMFY